MVDLSDEEIAAANERGAIEFETRPHAIRARYDRQLGLITLELYNGCTFSFPPRQLQGLAMATDDELAQVELSFTGYGLHWEALDADFTVPGLLEGRFGTEKFMKTHRAKFRQMYQALLDGRSNLDVQAAE